MTEKLKDYQVIDVFCGGTFYKVRHKVTNNIFAWKAYDCSAYSDEQIQNVVNDVKIISNVTSESLLRYYDTILHAPSKTLYFVLEYNSWRSIQELYEACRRAEDLHVAESFLWHLLHELARVCKAVETLAIVGLQKCITSANVFVGDKGELRINCFELATAEDRPDVMRQVGDVVRALCYCSGGRDDNLKEFHYSDDLRDVVSFLTDERNMGLRPDVVLYHPTVLTNLESQLGPKHFSEILVSAEYSHTSEVNKCDSEKAVELCRAVKPLPRTLFNINDSPVYCNISPKRKVTKEIAESSSPQGCLSPTLAALALELPGFIPRSRKPYTESLEKYNVAQRISEQTLSQQWMSRLTALRQREETLNQRERDIIAKEIVNSPSTKIIPLAESTELIRGSNSNGITLPPMMTQLKVDDREWFPRRRRRRDSSVRSKGRRKSYGYEDLDSSLSADAGDGSIIVTAAKITKENMPRRNIFPDLATKKVHFTAANPFIDSDDSVTLTFYELDNVDKEEYQAPKQERLARDISKFKYFDLEKVTSEKRSAMHWSHSSPSKQAKVSKSIFGDITNHSSIRKTPSKTSLSSRGSNTSRLSMMSAKSHWSVESCEPAGAGGVAERTRSARRQGLPQTPVAPSDIKKTKSRKSLLHFKTPFKFMSKN